MFDIASSKLLILGLVALMVIGPKDLPALLRTLGKYMGVVRRHANDFRAQFEEAMRDSELEEIKKQVQTMGEQTQATLREAETAIEKHVDEVRAEVDPHKALGVDPFADAPVSTPVTDPAPAPHDAQPASLPAATPPETQRAAEKTGA